MCVWCKYGVEIQFLLLRNHQGPPGVEPYIVYYDKC